MLSYRFPAAYQNRGAIDATLERNRLVVADGSKIQLGRFVGSGSYGMVFLSLDEKVVIKFETNPDGEDETMEYLMDLNHWASEFDVGPKFGSWGVVQIDDRQLEKLKKLVTQSQPRWFNKQNAGSIFYSIFEKWDTDLYQYLDGDDDMSRFNSIPRPVMERFAERIRKLHRRAVVHLDLAAKNVLVRVRDGVVEEMVLADFGLSRPRISWYFDSSEKFRESIAAYYAADWLTGMWSDHMNSVGNFRAWLKDEPFNADWCVVGAYALGNSWSEMIEKLHKMPPVFNFTAPWDEFGWLEVIVGDGTTVNRVNVHGLMSLAQLRSSLKGSFTIAKLQFESTSNKLVAIKDERSTYPGAVLREFRGEWYINLKPRIVKTE